MPKHDLPDGHENSAGLIDFRKHLQRRNRQTTQGNDPPTQDKSPSDIYRHAEYGDGKPPKLSWYDALWLGPFVAVGWMI